MTIRSKQEKNNIIPKIGAKEFNNYMGFDGDYYAIENAMDWIAMAYAFNENPINTYYLKNKDKMQLSENDIYVIETVFEIMMDNELLGE